MTPAQLIAQAIHALRSAEASDRISTAITDQIADMVINLHEILLTQTLCEMDDDD